MFTVTQRRVRVSRRLRYVRSRGGSQRSAALSWHRRQRPGRAEQAAPCPAARAAPGAAEGAGPNTDPSGRGSPGSPSATRDRIPPVGYTAAPSATPGLCTHSCAGSHSIGGPGSPFQGERRARAPPRLPVPGACQEPTWQRAGPAGRAGGLARTAPPLALLGQRAVFVLARRAVRRRARERGRGGAMPARNSGGGSGEGRPGARPGAPRVTVPNRPLIVAEPLGAEMGEQAEAVVITPAMLREEEQLEAAGLEQERQMLEKARSSWERESSEMRYKRLQHLLEKSNIYSKFLLTKMEQQQLEEQRRKEKLERKREMMLKSAKGQNPVDVKEEKSGAKKKRGREDGTYNISEIMSKEEILSVAKKSKVENQDESSAENLHPEDLQKNGDSNSVIKDRLCQAVRRSAKHFLDPVRKFNGQPLPFQQPKIFTGGVMRWYQVEGMEWLRMLWENGINGILADEMGLGKTIQCIATIALMVERGVPGPFLVCGPLSTLPNWMSEFKRFTPEIPLMLYHGTQQERRKLVRKIRGRQGSLQIYPVVITSFEIAMRDRAALQNCYWKYLIVDEGHRIKNMNCRLIRELKRFNADNKLLLTGTPLQNNLAELWSLLNFLLPDVFDDLKSFESWFDITSITETAEDIIAKEREQNILHMLHQILTPFLLRRLKSDVALEVPPKREVVVYAPLSKKQETFYTAIVNRTIRKLLGNNEEEAVELSSTGRPKRRSQKVVDYCEDHNGSPDDLEKLISRMQEEVEKERPVVEVSIPTDSEVNLKLQNIMMLLRKCCNHPYLIEYPLDPATQQFKVDEDLVKNSGKFLLLDRMLPELKKRGHKVLLFSQMTVMLDILMDYCYLRNFKFSRLDGSMSYSQREENMHQFNTDREVFLFLVSTRAGGLGINLTAADTVIIYDSDWNPQSDLQAQDRCHRIGQTKPVVVYRLVTANTIDQTIVERAAAKRKLEKLIIHKNQFKGGKSGLAQSKSCLDPQELLELLKSRDYEREVKGSKEKVISDKDLELLLDRSDLIDQMKASEKMKKEKMGVFKVLEESSESNAECVF